MSLRAWFPLNGDLHNQGLDTVTLTMPNATFTNDGKLGKCLSLPGTPTDNFSVPSMAGKKQMSIAYWVRVNEIVSNNWLDGISWYSTDGNSSKYSRQEFYYMNSSTNQTSTGIWYNGGKNDGYKHSVGEWHHYVIMIDYSSGYSWFYIDGVLKGTETNVNTAHYLTGTKFKLGDSTINISECDVRIYDHVLSPKEVKLLSQGLVCHYKLSDPYIEGTTNLITSLTKGGQTTVSGNSVTTSGENKDTYFTLNLSEDIVVGTQYTISCYAEGIPSGSVWNFPVGGQSNTSLLWVIHNGYNSYTFTANDFNWGTKRVFMDDSSRTFYGVTRFYDFQLEKKDHATPYAGLGGTRNELQVYDSSGYNNHLKAVGGPTVKTDSIRNSYSTHFTNTQYALANKNSNDGFLPTDAITVNLWIKCTNWQNPISCTEGGGWNFENSNGIQFPVYIRSVGYKVANSGVQPSTLLNDWHMLTGVFNGTDVKIYIDTILKATTATGSTNGIGYAANRLCVAAEAGGQTPASTYYVGNISDIRIYATALSAADIQQLYNTPVSVANTGAMLTQGEFVEVAT